jgi:hypothetical protein
MYITSIEKFDGGAEKLNMCAVARSGGYPSDGSDEDNTYAKFSPSATLSLTVCNPNLVGKFSVGEYYYLDFTPVPAAAPAEQPAEAPAA